MLGFTICVGFLGSVLVNLLLCIVGELAGRGSVAVDVGIGDR